RSSTESSVASPIWTWCSNSSSSCSKRSRRCSISVTSCPIWIRVRVRLAPTFPPPATRTYISAPPRESLDAPAREKRARRGRRERSYWSTGARPRTWHDDALQPPGARDDFRGEALDGLLGRGAHRRRASAYLVGQHLDGRRGGAHGAQPAGRVEL